MPLNILIVGAGVGGPTAAFLLLRSNPDHQITVIERHAELRANGQQIDLRAQGIPLVKKLGLLDAVKAKAVHERGLEILGKNGKPAARVTAVGSDSARQALTSDYEIMRGDMVQILYEETLRESQKAKGKGWIKYEFGKTVTELTQDDTGADVTFSDGNKGRYDLVIGADGQGSKTRQQVWGKEVSDASFNFLGVYAAFYSIPPVPDDGEFAKSVHAPGGRVVATRPSKPDLTGVYMMSVMEAEELEASLRQPIEQQKAAWAKLFADVGWQTDRLRGGMQASDDFYAFSLAQVKLEHFVRGRVALVGDAGYVPSPATGMGTTLSIAGAYVLAGELARRGGDGDDVPAALRAYEDVLRPFVAEAQKLSPGFPGLMMPKSEFGISALHWAASVITKLKVDKLLSRVLPESKGGWAPPEYPELKLDS